MLKLKIKGKKPFIYNGDDYNKIKQGTILVVTKAPDEKSIGDIVIRTDENEYPFIVIQGSKEDLGFLWGTTGDSYEFQVLDGKFIVEND